jgi:hypothetical protein
MRVEMDVPDYTEEHGVQTIWEAGCVITTDVEKSGHILITANQAGLISLARLFLSLAQPQVPIYQHIHLDELNSLEDGSCELIIQRM